MFIFAKSLLNKAYRGSSSQQGWTTEAHLIAGDTRTDKASVEAVMHKEGSVFLKWTSDSGVIVGCVNLQQHGSKIYLGMFAVSPDLQGAGIGKKLLAAAEEYAREKDCTAIYMTVITLRVDLIAWYTRHGYSDTGKRQTFQEDGISGRHLQPLEFATLEKQLD
ncbi:MAG: GNAT family N-acetyltransferase [Chitinophagaceae bacterium]|nr:MAG: GNAT family N-acetyltransferase [Chitinophagaceae bacterium]